MAHELAHLPYLVNSCTVYASTPTHLLETQFVLMLLVKENYHFKKEKKDEYIYTSIIYLKFFLIKIQTLNFIYKQNIKIIYENMLQRCVKMRKTGTYL